MSDQPNDEKANFLETHSSKLAPTQNQLSVLQKSDIGSATGNPRNKCALKPGFSLMGWIRLNGSGEDLAGTNGRTQRVTMTELAKHNKQDDAWMAIRGNVYNITRYMEYHPGGIQELMRGVGRDGTKLFSEVHGWVNYKKLLSKCYIGPLSSTIKIDESTSDSIVEANEPFNNVIFGEKERSFEIIPRFDWTQKNKDLTIYVYTRQGCNPGIILYQKQDTLLKLEIQLEYVVHTFNFELEHSVKWPPKEINIAVGESGKVEIKLEKSTPNMWTKYGTHTFEKHDQTEKEDIINCEVVYIGNHNNNSFELVLRPINKIIIIWPLGCHISLISRVNGDTLSRSYTPVPEKYLKYKQDFSLVPLNLNFIIKNYSHGLMSTSLRKLQKKSVVELCMPKINLKLENLLRHRRITFLAAGSGLTPFLQLIDFLLKRTTNRIEYLCLICFNKTEDDIWCREVLNKEQSQDERFQIINVLSQGSHEWTGLQGHVSKQLLEPLIDRKGSKFSTFVGLCGPDGFNELAMNILRELSFSKENIHVFHS